MTIRQLLDAWNKFWFTPMLPTSVAVFRIVVGLLVLQFCYWIQRDFSVFFGPNAIVSPEVGVLLGGTQKLNVLDLIPGSDSTSVVFWILVVAAIYLTVGLCSRLSALVIYLIFLSLDASNQFVLHSGIRMMYIMILFLAFSRCGDALSLDRWIKAKLTGKPLSPPEPGNAVAQRLMQVQLAIVYWSAFSWKLLGPAWVDGTAVYYASHLTDFAKFPIPYVFDHLWTCQLLTWGTLLVEFSLCTLIWIKEFRYPILIAGLFFHLGLEWTLVIPLFQQIMIASYINFVESEDLLKIASRIKRLLLAAVV